MQLLPFLVNLLIKYNISFDIYKDYQIIEYNKTIIENYSLIDYIYDYASEIVLVDYYKSYCD